MSAEILPHQKFQSTQKTPQNVFIYSLYLKTKDTVWVEKQCRQAVEGQGISGTLKSPEYLYIILKLCRSLSTHELTYLQIEPLICEESY